VLNLPSVVESYKTLDDVNLVKTCDIGQVRLVWKGGEAGDLWAVLLQRTCSSHSFVMLGHEGRLFPCCSVVEPVGCGMLGPVPFLTAEACPPPCCHASLQVLVVGEDPQLAEEAASGESLDGVTPPMRNARGRIFRKPIDVPPAVVSKVEYDLLTILAVSCAGEMGGGEPGACCTHWAGQGCSGQLLRWWASTWRWSPVAACKRGGTWAPLSGSFLVFAHM
jgi:TATA-binding protein-associated factor Taf7